LRKLIASLVAAIYSVMLTASPVLAQTTGVTASVTVETICDVDASPGSITFDGGGLGGTVPPGTNSGSDLPNHADDDETVTLANNGNADTTSLTVEGIDWAGANPPNAMNVGRTEYDPDGLQSFSGTALVLNPGATIYGGVLADNDSNDLLFRVLIPADQPADTYDQTITFTFGCDQLI